MKKLIALLLLGAMMTSALLSCSEAPTENNTDKTDAPAAETVSDIAEETADETAEVVTDNLPEKNYDGYSYNIYTRNNTTHYQFLTEEYTGEVLNDAIYDRNLRVGDRFNVVFTETEYSDENAPTPLVMSGDTTYSLMNVRCTAANTMAQKNYLYNISNLEYIDLDKPYWDADLTKAISIGPYYFSAIGATNLTAIDFMTTLLFNKQILSENNLGDIYTMVREGTWTFDRFGEMGAAVTRDVDGNGTYDANDTWGVLGSAKFLHCSFIQSAGAMYMYKDAENMPTYSITSDEHFINVFARIFEICNDNNAWYLTSDTSNESVTYHNMFRNGQGLFMSTIFYYIETMRDMDHEFGVIPYPKYDEAQEEYYSRISFFDTAVIPTSVDDVERASIILEALTCDSHNSVIPAYKDVALKTKYSRDEESSDMIDLVLETRVLDLGDTYFCSSIREGLITNMFINDERNIVSKAKTTEKVIGKTIEKMLKEYAKVLEEQAEQAN